MARSFTFGYRCAKIRVSQFTLAMGVVLAGSVLSVSGPQPGMMAWANEPHALKTIDFVTSGTNSLNLDNTMENRTDVMLYTGGIVPYRTVYSDPNKTILEFDQVNASDTVNTHFMGTSGNITHVIVQPLSDNKLRLILRGENLGQVTVGFKDPQENTPVITAESDAQGTGSAARAGLHSEFGEAFDQMKSDSRTGETSSVRSTSAEPLSTLSLANEGEGAARFNQGIPPKVTVSPASKAESALVSRELNPFEKKSSPSIRSNQAENQKPSSKSGLAGYLDTALLAGLLPWAAPGVMLLLLMAGLGWFIRHKWIRLNQANADTQTLASSLPLDASVNQLVAHTRDWKFKDVQGSVHLEEIPLKVMPKKNAGMDSPIGLGSLLPQDRLSYRIEEVAEPEAFYDPDKAEREWISQQRARLSQSTLQEELTARQIPQATIKQAVPQKQVINRYAQNPVSAPRQPIATPMGQHVSSALKNDLKNQELLRTAEQKRQAAASPRNTVPAIQPSIQKTGQKTSQQIAGNERVFGRKPAPKTTAAAPTLKNSRQDALSKTLLPNNTLPNNPEVLAFLNAVAEKMDRENKSAVLKPVALR